MLSIQPARPMPAGRVRRSRGRGGRTSAGSRASARCATRGGSSPASRWRRRCSPRPPPSRAPSRRAPCRRPRRAPREHGGEAEKRGLVGPARAAVQARTLTEQPTAEPTTRPSTSPTKVAKAGLSKSSSHSARTSSTTAAAATRRRVRAAGGQAGELELGEDVDVVARRPPDHDAWRARRHRVAGASRSAWTCWSPKPRRNQASTSAGRRRNDRVVRRPALLDPARGGERVEVAHGLRLVDRMPGRLDPDVRAPGRVGARRAEQEADGAPPRVATAPEASASSSSSIAVARDVHALVGDGQRRLDGALRGVPAHEQPAASSRKRGSNAMELEARHRARAR